MTEESWRRNDSGELEEKRLKRVGGETTEES